MFKPVMTFEQIAELLNITRQRAEQLEKQALRKARKVMRGKGYEPSLFFEDPTYKRPLTDKQVQAEGYGDEAHLIETIGEIQDDH